MPSLQTARRYAETLRHLRPVQLVGRVAGEGKRRLGLVRAPAPPEGFLPAGLQPRVPFPHHDPWNTPGDLRAGRFTFLGDTRALGFPPDWAAADAPLLWQFNLHYHQFLHLLAPAEQANLARYWAEHNPPGTPVAWHPYPTALRVLAWTKAGFGVLGSGTPGLARSLYQQAGHLYRGLETYHPGNHLLENARALVLAGRWAGDQGEGPAWLRRGLRILLRETPDQVLPDGAYFERSPMYHQLMLEAYLDVLNVHPLGDRATAPLRDAAMRMAGHLQALLHPDGSLPLFNDAAEEIAPPPADTLAYAQAVLGETAPPRAAYPHAGVFVLQAPGAHVVCDAGPVGPDHLPAHAHADIFSFEASFGGLPFVTDTGVFEYAAGARRQHDRSTAAHNTVGIDGLDQAECWASFRVARRFPPEQVRYEERGPARRLSGVFSGWSTLVGDGIVHRRAFELEPGRLVIADDVTGAGQHRVEARVHLHPEVTLEEQGGGAFVLVRQGVRVAVQVDGGAARVERSRYSPRFGAAIDRPCLVIGAPAAQPVALPVRFRCTFSYALP